MKIAHEAAAFDLMTFAISTRRSFWKAKADIDLLPSAIWNIQFAVKMSCRNISEVKEITKILGEHLWTAVFVLGMSFWSDGSE